MFCAMRLKKYNISKNPKYKGYGRFALKMCIQHNLRIVNPKNAYVEMSKNNTHEGTFYLLDRIEKRVKELRDSGIRVKDNAVTCVQVIGHVSNPYWKQAKNKEEYLQLEKEFIDGCKKFGQSMFGPENFMCADIHRDEGEKIILEDGTVLYPPHVHMALLPIINGKFNCSAVTKGADKMSALQDRYFECMPKNRGIERGLKKDMFRDYPQLRKPVREWYKEISQPNLTDENALSKLVYTETIMQALEKLGFERIGHLKDIEELKADIESYKVIAMTAYQEAHPDLTPDEIYAKVEEQKEIAKGISLNDLQKETFKEEAKKSRDAYNQKLKEIAAIEEEKKKSKENNNADKNIKYKEYEDYDINKFNDYENQINKSNDYEK